MRRVAAVLFGLIVVLGVAGSAFAQDAAQLEADAKKAFDSGRFKEAGERYVRAAEAAGISSDRKANLFLQSAWAYYIAGNSKNAREELKAAM